MTRSSAKTPPSEPNPARYLAGLSQPVLIARNGAVCWANDAAQHLLEAAADRPLQGSSVEALLGEKAARALRDAKSAGSDGVPLRRIAMGATLAGRPLTMQVAALEVPWEGGRALQLALEEQTETAVLRARAELSESRLRDLVEGSLQGIYVHVDHRFLFVNRPFAKIFGYDRPDDVVALGDVLKVYAPEERERMVGYYRERIAGGHPPTRYEFQGVRRDGQRIWLENLVRMMDWEGRRAVLAMVVDITERKQAEARLLANEQKYRDVVEGSVQGILVHRHGVPLFANQAFANQFGFDSPQSVYDLGSIDQLIAEEDRERLTGYVRDRIAGKPVPSRYVYRARRLDGRLMWMENLVREVEWEGEPALQIATVDVSERVEATQQLHESEQLMRMMVDRLPHVVFVKGPDRGYRFVNRAFADFHGLQPEDVINRRVEELPVSLARDRETFQQTDDQVLTTGEAVDLATVTLTPIDSEPRIFRLQKLPLRDDSGTVVGIVGIGEDITERKRAEETLQASQRLLHTVVDLIPHAVFLKERDGRFQFVNRAFAEFYGLRPEEIIGRTREDLPQEVRPGAGPLMETDRQVLESGEAADIPEITLVRHGAPPSVRHLTKVPLLGGDGQVIGILGVSEDISERKRAEEELQRSRTLLQSVFDLLPLWVFVKDTERRFLMINRKMAEDYALRGQLNPGELLDLGTTITAEERSAVYELDQRVLQDGTEIEVPELTITLPEKGARLFRSARVPLRDADGRISGIVGIMEDITDRRRTEQVLQQAQKLESLGVLAGGIAHDFNNLLVSILGNAGLAQLDLPPGSPAAKPMEKIERAGQRAADLCRQLLAYAGQGSFEITRINLNALIEEMTDLLHVSLSRDIKLDYQFDPHLPQLEVDTTQIRQVVMNLIMNGAEAIGDQPGQVTVTTRRVFAGQEQLLEFIQGDQLRPGQYVMLEVSDTGPGIEPATLGRIFDPFFTTKFTGRGLGLAAVLGIVRGHHGAMRVVSTLGRGAVFRILLPLESGPEPAAPEAVELRS